MRVLVSRELAALVESDPQPTLFRVLLDLIAQDFQKMIDILDADELERLAASPSTRAHLWRELMRSTIVLLPPDFATRLSARLDDLSAVLARADLGHAR